jgi:hypothetical protein
VKSHRIPTRQEDWRLLGKNQVRELHRTLKYLRSSELDACWVHKAIRISTLFYPQATELRTGADRGLAPRYQHTATGQNRKIKVELHSSFYLKSTQIIAALYKSQYHPVSQRRIS